MRLVAQDSLKSKRDIYRIVDWPVCNSVELNRDACVNAPKERLYPYLSRGVPQPNASSVRANCIRAPSANQRRDPAQFAARSRAL